MKYLLFIVLTSVIVNATAIKTYTKPGPYIDFGVHGKEYDIKEENFYEYVVNKAKNFKIDKNELKETIRSEVNRLATYRPSITSSKDSYVENWHKNLYEFKVNYINPVGRLVYKKGEKIQAPLVPVQQDICFLDGKIMPTLQNQIDFFKKKYPKCIFLFSNVNIRGLRKIFTDLDIFPANDVIIDRFQVKHSIGVVSLKDDKIRKEYFSIEKFKR